jgi:uncharacterized protein YndB with AHSA1/START domain
MSPTIAIAPVRKSVIVKATPQRAFEVFTINVDRWWPRSKGIGATPIRQSIIEPFVGGRWYTIFEDGREAVVGHVRVWQPGRQFVVSWEIDSKWKPDSRVALASEVDVRFLPDADGSTRVELEHRDFERMGAAEGETMRGAVDGGWPAMLDLFAKEASRG